MATQPPLRILIVGAGAVGCFYASRMHQPEARRPVLVSLVCRSNYGAVRANGVRLRTRDFGEYVFRPEHTFSSVGAAAAAVREWDYVVVATKALPEVSDDSAAIAPVVGRDTTIMLIQNGVGVEAPYWERYPDQAVLSGVTVVSAEQVAPGEVVQYRWTRISIGPYTGGRGGGTGGPRTAEIVGVLRQGGIKDAEECSEKALQQVRWHKIAINGSMNPSSVLANGTENARMTEDGELRRHLLGCMEEVFAAAEAVLGEPLPSKLAKGESLMRSISRNTGGRSSMQVDWERGQRLELEAILGNAVRLARAHGVDMPRVQAMYALLTAAQARRDERRAAKL